MASWGWTRGPPVGPWSSHDRLGGGDCGEGPGWGPGRAGSGSWFSLHKFCNLGQIPQHV